MVSEVCENLGRKGSLVHKQDIQSPGNSYHKGIHFEPRYAPLETVKRLEERLEITRVLLSLLFLAISSWFDFKTREVSNRLWVFYATSSFSLSFTQFYLSYIRGDHALGLLWLFSFGVTSGLSLVLFYLGFFGGADAKALICLSIALPVYPAVVRDRFRTLTPVFPLAVLSNAVLASSLMVLVIAFHNLIQLVQHKGRLFEGLKNEPLRRKILAFFIGIKVQADRLQKRDHYLPLEYSTRSEGGEIVRHLRITLRLEDETASSSNDLSNLAKQIEGKVWATPGLPFLVFVTVGFAAALLFGDFTSWLVSQMTATQSA